MAAFKLILVHLDDTPRAALRLDTALALAASHQAHLVALNVRSRSNLSPLLIGQFGSEMEALLAKSDTESAARAKALLESRPVPAGVTVEWRDVSGDLADSIALHARYSDLVVVGQASPEDEETAPLAELLLLSVGRPVLVLPYAGEFPVLGQRIMVGWNASREATRAVNDAMPLLEQADIVQVVIVNPGHGNSGHGDVPGADICQYLSRHGVSAVCESIQSEDLNVGEMLLNRAADEDSDLIVMGGYGRSRFSELVLGGATRHLLAHMTVPVLLSH